jgi:geranylgeranyl pyrophosphate synthase
MWTAMNRVDALLTERCTGTGPFQHIARHIFARPGKRIRGRLVLACTGLQHTGNPIERDAIEAATAVELLHEASLVHDDICDAATKRRGAPSVVAAFGIRAAGLAGAFLAGHALVLLGGVLERRGQRLDLGPLSDLIEGQILECVPPSASLRDARQRYERVVRGKTAVLFRFACALGALLDRCPAPVRASVETFAVELAFAFQVLDDVRDLEDPADLGKPACKDLACGLVTWPVLNWLESVADPVAGLERLRRTPKATRDIEALRSMIVGSGATEHARGFARARLAAARSALTALPASWGREQLVALITRVERQ